MQFALTIASPKQTAKEPIVFPAYDAIAVSRRALTDGRVSIAVFFSANNATALRVSLANAIIALVLEMDACDIPRENLGEARIRLAAADYHVAPSPLIKPTTGKPFVVGGRSLDESGAIFVAADKVFSAADVPDIVTEGDGHKVL